MDNPLDPFYMANPAKKYIERLEAKIQSFEDRLGFEDSIKNRQIKAEFEKIEQSRFGNSYRIIIDEGMLKKTNVFCLLMAFSKKIDAVADLIYGFRNDMSKTDAAYDAGSKLMWSIKDRMDKLEIKVAENNKKTKRWIIISGVLSLLVCLFVKVNFS
jgi:hypothetical protein